MNKKEYSIEVGRKTLTAEFNDLADQASGSVLVRYGDTVVLATAVISKYPRDNYDFFPLTVDFEEKFYAAGKILGGRFNRREGRPTDEAILSGRIVDRTIRPLFEQHIRHEVQIIVTVLSIGEDDPDVLAVLAASLALSASNIPWSGPVGVVRIGKNKEDLIINPTYEERESEEFEGDILACGKDGTLNMIEVGANEISESDLKEGFSLALKEIEKIQKFQEGITKEIGKEKMVVEKPKPPEETEELFKETTEGRMSEVVFSGAGDESIHELEKGWVLTFAEKMPEVDVNLAKGFFEEKVNDILHKEAIEKEKRADGRRVDEIRSLFVKTGGLSPMLHGSGIFYRGGTHVLSVLTLGGPGDGQIIDGMEVQTEKRFMHHYNFPPFSSGETGRVGGFNRRMIGHGALAEKALIPVLPSKENFPYTIRLVSECLASNGSTSMGSVCAGTLALMDGGVPIKTPVAGIAVGLMMEDQKTYKVLTDIQGPEDHFGDMDFKVAGTEEGITAVQMDVKVSGIPLHILEEALERGKQARLEILGKIKEEISEPRSDISPNAPKIIMIKIKPDQIGLVIGSGGKTINQIKENSGGAEIDIEDDGNIFITGKDGGAEKAAEVIKEMTKEYKVGEKAVGEVIKIVDFGAFVKIGFNTEGLLHISEVAPMRIESVAKVLSVGDKVPVIIKAIDDQGKIKVSLKDADLNFFKKETG